MNSLSSISDSGAMPYTDTAKGGSGALKKYIVKSKSDAAVDSGEEKVHQV